MRIRNVGRASAAASLFLSAFLSPVEAQTTFPYDMDPAEFVDRLLAGEKALTLYLVEPCPTPGSWQDRALDELFARDLTPVWVQVLGAAFQYAVEECGYPRFREWFFAEFSRAALGGGARLEFLAYNMKTDHSEATTRFLLDFLRDASYPLGAREMAGTALLVERPAEERLNLLEEMARSGEILMGVANGETHRLVRDDPAELKRWVAGMIRETPDVLGLQPLISAAVDVSLATEARTGRRTEDDEALADALEAVIRSGDQITDPRLRALYEANYARLRPGRR